ncbi:uncharacterized protein LOC119652884 [Hermetia illucens]|uniref:uncharacterized protein LOC119652884 n=1 Tax=Hermetia illucens TaxID=343691 RepID=UPI0018CC219E|nr:uncharacterized protein LOC119652884 [Hermetia illucens]
MKNPLWFIVWLIVLIIIAFPVAAFCAGWYILVYALTVCIPGLSGLSDLLLQGAQFAHYCAQAMMDCRSLC